MRTTFRPEGAAPPSPDRIRPCAYGGVPYLILDGRYRPDFATWTDSAGRPHPYHGRYTNAECTECGTYDVFHVAGYRYVRRVRHTEHGSYVTIAGRTYRIDPGDAIPMVDYDRADDNATPRDTGSNTHGSQYRLDTCDDVLARRFPAPAHTRRVYAPDTDDCGVRP